MKIEPVAAAAMSQTGSADVWLDSETIFLQLSKYAYCPKC
jgi:hypothetical protein